MKLTLTSICLLLQIVIVYGQNTPTNRNCATLEVQMRQINEDAEMLQRQEQIERHIQQFATSPRVESRAVINIPVVVHVVYHTGTENISDAQIQSQIDVLNQDFRLRNSEISSLPTEFRNLAADVELNFCLASKDPNGSATNGIERLYTAKTTWGTNDDVKRPNQGGCATWDASAYLNLWVCNIGGGLLGYGQFPGGPLNTDGVVIDYRYFGTIGTVVAPFNKGRTATHEIGHWLNLIHIWGDAPCGDDLVSDTPLHHGANYGCPTYPYKSTACGSLSAEMTMNFMDYTTDACMGMFSQGQKTRMLAMFATGGIRASLRNSQGCSAPVTAPCNVPTNIALTNVSTTGVNVTWDAVAGAVNYNMDFKLNANISFSSFQTTNRTVQLQGLTSGNIYNVRIKTNCTGASSVYSAILNFTTTSITPPPPPPVSDVCTNNYEPNDSRTTATTIAPYKTIHSMIGSAGDRDWFSFKTTATTPNFKIKMSNLPADFDLKLYSSAGLLLGSSENMGTTDEYIVYNTNKADSFYIQVFGYNANFNNGKCYDLNITLSPTAATSVIVQTAASRKGFGATLDNDLLISPNPVSTYANILLDLEADTEIETSIINMTGMCLKKEVFAVSKENNFIQLDMNNIPNGIYLIAVKNGETIKVKKIVVAR
jgi:hypothetical protein